MDNRQKIYLTLAISAIIIALLFITVDLFIDEIKELSAELERGNNLLASYEEKSGSYFKGLQKDYTDFELRIIGINGSFIDSEEVVSFILALEQAAALSGNYQEIEEISSPEENDNVLAFRISLWGNFPNLIKFLAQIENLDYFVDSNSLKIARIETRELKNLTDRGINVSAGSVKSTLEINAYVR